MTDRPRTLGELVQSGYQPRNVKDEMRANLLQRLRDQQPLFSGIHGYDETVIPQIQNAILSRHDLLFLGLRGQGKTRMLRMLVELLDELIGLLVEFWIAGTLSPFLPPGNCCCFPRCCS